MNSISNSFLFFVSLLAIFTLWRPVTQITKTMLSTLLKMVRWHEFNCDTRLSLILIYKQMEVTIQHIYEINLLINSESKKHQWLLSLCKSILFASLLKKRKHNPEFGALIFRSSHNHWNCNCVTIMAVYCLPKKTKQRKSNDFIVIILIDGFLFAAAANHSRQQSINWISVCILLYHTFFWSD